MLDVCVIVYLDDILIYSDTPEEHREHVKEVLRRLRKHRLYANPRSANIHPLAFLSRMLHAAELNYDTHDKELLAIFEAFKAWRHYLEGLGDPVDVITDHKNLEYFQVNPHNFRPIFTNEQLTASLRATFLEGPVLRASIITDIEALHQAIILALPADPSSAMNVGA
ncbi:retrotransposon nucleocapsid protein [Lentinula edodes]|uniref:Retrotransposon nucleocapsid protein n=1 Tax=Lentinula edodes TaxID=5353 RepID=A0A1Q3EF90_LENED|nr:retrotransposon nucleocapsid protein [Lentinula edodes]